jgi:hypothetical protein
MELQLKRTEKQYGRILGGILNKKLGADLYFLAFGILGVFLIPGFFFIKMRSQRARRESIDAQFLLDENVDLDERSLDFIPGDSEALRKEIIQRERRKLEIKELEKEFYGY